MKDEDKDERAGGKSSIQDFLRKRAEIDKIIQDRFQRPITIMFTDIVASTEFFETHGDIEGRSMIQRHNDLLYPIIEKHGGRVIKPLGDGLMMAFEEPQQAALAAVEIQKALAEENQGKAPISQIWVKVSIHHGLGIVEDGDVYGDVVNTSARLNALAEKGQILATQDYIAVVRDQTGIDHDYVGSKSLKGKAAPLEIHRIVWDPIQEADLRRSIDDKALREKADMEILWLDFSLEGDLIKLMSYFKDEHSQTVKHVEEYPFPESEIQSLAEQVGQSLAAMDQRGRSRKEVLARLRELGERLHHLLLPSGIKVVSERAPRQLVLQLDDRLVYIPWEMLHDGEEFLCLKYSMGRLVSTSREVIASRRVLSGLPVKMLFVADPRGDLGAGGLEGNAVREELEESQESVSLDLLGREATCEFLQDHLADYDLFHYAGHADYDEVDPSQSGLLLVDGKVEAVRLLEFAREKPLPSLVFTNACQSGRTESWRSGKHLFGLANAFLVAGVRHYIGSTMDLFDRSSAAFAKEFYHQLIENRPIGEALRNARLQTISHYGEETLTWACYVLYGDPTSQYFPSRDRETAETMAPVERKLAAILSADAQGYSRLMGEDEVGTIRTLAAHRGVMTGLIRRYRGRVVSSPGDSLLAEFSSVVDSVQCAAEIQRELAARNAALPEDRRMLFRIGINLGDVIEEGEQIFGDGVNIAARLEGMAEGGGVCISGTVYDQVKNKIALGYEYLGEQNMKNIAEPIRVYRIDLGRPAVPRIKKMMRLRPLSLSRPTWAIFLILLLGVILIIRLWPGKEQWIRKADEGFNLIRMGKVAEAEEVFQTLRGKDPIYYRGMAAVYLHRGNLRKAEETLLLAKQDRPDDPYLAVVQGHLELGKGRFAEAESAFNKALEAEDLVSWQRAECHFGLGRIFLNKGALQQAIEELDRALALDPSFVQAHTAKGLALERMGKLHEAMAEYEKGTKINTSDPVSAILYRRTRDHVATLEKSERRARIDALVADLLKAYRQGPRPPERTDEWSSKPRNLFFLDLEAKGQPAPMEGENAFISERLLGRVTASGRLHRVERALLDRVLEELKLSGSELADPQTALQLGRILSAHLLATGTILRYRGQLQVNLRAVDTETTKIAATATGACELGEDPQPMIEKLARDFLERIAAAYPIRARITEVRDQEVVLNVGSSMGVAQGMRVGVAEEEGRGLELQVKDVQEKTCTAIVGEPGVSLKKGWRVEEVRS